MVRRFVNLLRGLSADWLGKLGVALVTSSFLLFLFMELLRVVGILTSSYVGLISYMLLPALFILGLLLIPLAWIRLRRRTGLGWRQLAEKRFRDEDLQARFLGTGLVGGIALLILVSLLFLAGASARMLHFMDTPRFCGTACHDIMGPEWATYQASPHAHVACVECHVGEGAGALLNAKLNGLWQVVSASFNLYERPIPTPVHQLRPARETCEKCHWPDKFYGDRLRVTAGFAADEANTPSYSTLSLKVGSGEGGAGQIHWHVAEANAVRYASVDDQREEMVWVEVLQPDGSWKRYTNRRLRPGAEEGEDSRLMDCVDCHNRATHIYEDPESGLDRRMAAGELDPGLPYIKRKALGALLAGYPDREAALDGIDRRIRGFYRDEYPLLAGSRGPEIDRAVESLQAMYARNVHHGMKVEWGSYPSMLGHRGEGGCFRCHQEHMVDEAGAAIPYDCTLCHSILAQGSPEPFRFLMPLDEKTDPDYHQAEYLRKEFLGRGN